jgi:hypothetical protein
VQFTHWAKGLKIGYTEKEWLFSTGLHNPENYLKIEQKIDFRVSEIEFRVSEMDISCVENKGGVRKRKRGGVTSSL